MGRSNTRVSGDSTTFSDGGYTAADTDVDTDAGSKDAAVDLLPPPSDSSPFHEGERVFAFHGHRHYLAKVQRVECRMNKWTYHVHYIGWKKKWDEWVVIDRLMKFTEGNVQKQSPQSKNPAMEKNVKPGRAFQIKRKHSAAARGKKRYNDSLIKEKGTIPLEKLVNIQIPPSLKKQLLDDCEFITHLGKLVKLPRTPNVDEILKKYSSYRAKKDSMLAETVGEILNGLRCYFDKALPAMLLYKSERKQYEEAISDHVSPSSIYGAEHLLRLFVKLPEILYYAKIEEETLTKLQRKLLDLLKFLQKSQSAFFLATYQTPENLHTNIKKQDD